LNVAGGTGSGAAGIGDTAQGYIILTAGSGGANPLGVGGPAGTLSSTGGDSAQAAGTGCGGGGSGAGANQAAGTAHAGSNGANGCVIVYAYY
jgi:hypothetical protein